MPLPARPGFLRMMKSGVYRRHLALLVLVLDEEIGLAGIGDRAGEVDVFHFLRPEIQLGEHLLEEALSPGWNRSRRAVVETEIGRVLALDLFAATAAAFPVLGIDDFGRVAPRLPSAAVSRLKPSGLTSAKATSTVSSLHFVEAGLGLDLPAQVVNVGQRDVVVAVQPADFVVDGPERQAIAGRQFNRDGIGIGRLGAASMRPRRPTAAARWASPPVRPA